MSTGHFYTQNRDPQSPNPANCGTAKALHGTPKEKLAFRSVPRAASTKPQMRPHWYEKGLAELVKLNVVAEYPALVERVGAVTAQYEHTLLLRDSGAKEVFTRGCDY